MKKCRKCKVEKPFAEFCKQAGNPDGFNNQCRGCDSVESKEYYAANRERVKEASNKYYAANRERAKEACRRRRAKNPEKFKEYNRKYQAENRGREYGLSLKEFEQMRLTQGGACAICRVVPKSPLHIDHDHSSGKVRALLCGSCNRALGLFKDSPELARAAADYLDRFLGIVPRLTNQTESRQNKQPLDTYVKHLLR